MSTGQYSATDVQPGTGKYSPADLAPEEQDLLQRALNYRTGNAVVDAPMGVAQGVAKGLISTGVGGGKLIRGALGMEQIDPSYADSVTKPNGIGQGTGKFAEQTAELLAPAGAVSKGLKGASAVTRIAGQVAAGSGMSALQTGGDPTSTILGGVLSGAGEAVPAIAGGVKALAKDLAPNAQNFKTALAAVPHQMPAIQRALPTLIKDGIKPAENVADMAVALKDRLAQLGQDYQALPADIPTREIPAQDILSKLSGQVSKFTTKGGVVPPTMKAQYSQLQDEIDAVKLIASKQGGKLTFDDLQKLRDGANELTDWTSPKGQRNLYESLGNTYRAGMDQIAPETTNLNRNWQQYSELNGIADKNASFGRGTTTSGLTTFGEKAGGAVVGAGMGYSAGHALSHATGIPGLEYLGGAAGAAMWPKLTGTAMQAVKNAADNGTLAKLSAPLRASLQLAMKVGDEGAIGRILSRAAVEAQQSSAPGK